MSSAEHTIRLNENWTSDPELRAQTERILSMSVLDRLLQLEAEANFFSRVRPLD